MLIALIGPISHWWDHPDTPEHLAYLEHRSRLSEALVAAGFLVYSACDAIRGPWHGNEYAQAINDQAILLANLVVNMRPKGIPSVGTDAELSLCHRLSKPVLWAPPSVPLESIVSAVNSQRREVRASRRRHAVCGECADV